MNSEKWKTIKAVFNDALQLPHDQQKPFVHVKLKDDKVALEEVLGMLATEDEQNTAELNFSKIVSSNVAQALEKQNILSAGEVIDNFVVMSSIGEGGMGSVFLAQRKQDDFEQFVAIKVIHKQQVNKDSIERFRRERQILASLNHRNIASFIGGGETSKKLPYIILEYIIGTPIIDYCQQQQLDIEQRLQLFKQVLNAVSYAHQNLVVHRDIKPSNVMVTENGDVKLLDFGIAKLLQSQGELTENDLTREENRLLTPGNASPEQVLGGQISTRTDIYGLGTLLMHMLCDEAIFTTTHQTQREIETLILEQAPLKPSKKCALSAAPEIRRRATVLKGDLDTIVMTAVQKDPQRRYATVEQFYEDINRFQQHYPISAKPDSLLYSLNKFVKRNTVSSALATLFVVSLIAFSSLLAMQAKQVQQERDNALTEAAVSQQIAAFMTDMFDASDPNISNGKDISARTILLSAVDKLHQLDSPPEIKGKLLTTLGKVHIMISEYEQADTLLNEADKLIPQYGQIHLTNELVDRINIDFELANLAYFIGQYDDAKNRYIRLIDILNRHNSATPVLNERVNKTLLSEIHHGLADALAGDGQDEASLNHYKTALDMQLSLGATKRALSIFYIGYGHALRHTGKYQEAITALTQGLSLARQPGTEDTLDTASALNQLASTYRDLGDYSKALDAAQEGLNIRLTILKTAQPEVIASMGNVSNIYAKLGRLNDAIDIRLKMQGMIEPLLGKEHDYYGATTVALANFQLEAGDLNSAKASFQQALISLRAAHPEGNYNISRPLMGIGQIELKTHNVALALDYLRQAFEITEQYLNFDHYLKAKATAWYSLALRSNGQTVEADTYKHQALAIQQRLFGLNSVRYANMRDLVDDTEAL